MDIKSQKNNSNRINSPGQQKENKFKPKSSALYRTNSGGLSFIIHGLTPKIQIKNKYQSDQFKKNQGNINQSRPITAAQKLSKYRSVSPIEKQIKLDESNFNQLNHLHSRVNDKILYIVAKNNSITHINQGNSNVGAEKNSHKNNVNMQESRKNTYYQKYLKQNQKMTFKKYNNQTHVEDKIANKQIDKYLEKYQVDKAKNIAEEVIENIKKNITMLKENQLTSYASIKKHKADNNRIQKKQERPLTSSAIQITDNRKQQNLKNQFFSRVKSNNDKLEYGNTNLNSYDKLASHNIQNDDNSQLQQK